MRDVASRIRWKRKHVDVEWSFHHVSLAWTFVFGGLFFGFVFYFNGIYIALYEWFGGFFIAWWLTQTILITASLANAAISSNCLWSHILSFMVFRSFRYFSKPQRIHKTKLQQYWCWQHSLVWAQLLQFRGGLLMFWKFYKNLHFLYIQNVCLVY